MSVSDSILAVLTLKPATPATIRESLNSSSASEKPFNMGQITQTLSRMERDELISAAGSQPSANGHHATIWQITDNGQEKLRQWWEEPVPHTHLARDELATKISLACESPGIDILSLLDLQRNYVLGELRKLRLKLHPSPPQHWAERVLLERRTYDLEAEVRWLDRIEEIYPDHTPGGHDD